MARRKSFTDLAWTPDGALGASATSASQQSGFPQKPGHQDRPRLYAPSVTTNGVLADSAAGSHLAHHQRMALLSNLAVKKWQADAIQAGRVDLFIKIVSTSYTLCNLVFQKTHTLPIMMLTKAPAWG